MAKKVTSECLMGVDTQLTITSIKVIKYRRKLRAWQIFAIKISCVHLPVIDIE